jgi:hypothetical protein
MIREYLQKMHEIPGWFFDVDVQIFLKINELQVQRQISGDLLEIGVYCGKSAILLGYFTRHGEQLTVCDLFGTAPLSTVEQIENNKYYADLTLDTFEKNYRRFHGHLPNILRCPSSDLCNKGLGTTFRLIHVDGSHQYDAVRHDIVTAKTVLVDGGIIVFDDYRSFHTPGVAAAVWQEVVEGTLRLLCVTTSKMYAFAGNEDRGMSAAFTKWATGNEQFHSETELILGHEFLRLAPREIRAGLVRRIYWEVVGGKTKSATRN